MLANPSGPGKALVARRHLTCRAVWSTCDGDGRKTWRSLGGHRRAGRVADPNGGFVLISDEFEVTKSTPFWIGRRRIQKGVGRLGLRSPVLLLLFSPCRETSFVRLRGQAFTLARQDASRSFSFCLQRSKRSQCHPATSIRDIKVPEDQVFRFPTKVEELPSDT